MKELAQYTLSSSANSVTFTGLDSAHQYENIIVFYKVRSNLGSASQMYIAPNYNGSTTFGGGTTVAMSSGSDLNYQTYGGEVNGMPMEYSVPGSQDLGYGYGIVHVSNRGVGEKVHMFARFGISGVLHNAVQGAGNGISGLDFSGTNSAVIDSLRFSVHSSGTFQFLQVSIYGS